MHAADSMRGRMGWRDQTRCGWLRGHGAGWQRQCQAGDSRQHLLDGGAVAVVARESVTESLSEVSERERAWPS